MNRHLSPLLASVLFFTALPLTAQQADFVLFGDHPAERVSLDEHREAVHPISAPYYHEDSFVTSDLRAVYVYHDFPKSSAIDGGNAQVYAAQVRLALTDRLQLVAYKDGWVDLDSGLVSDEGWNDLAAGLKYKFLEDWDRDLHAAVGLGYEIGLGDDEVLQKDDELRLWASANQGFEALHLGGTVNLLIPTGSEDALGDSTRLIWHLHADLWTCPWFSPVVELNGYHTLDEGDNTPLPFSGVDVANLGGGQSEDVITAAFGGEVRVIDDLALRFAYETPLTKNDDLYGYRWTISAVFSF
jgi:hypothetical protein